MVAQVKSKSLLNKIVAQDIMTEEVVVVNAKMTIGQVAHLMLRNRVSGYPVTDKKKKVIGVVTVNDLFSLVDKLAWECVREAAKKNHKDLQQKIAGQKNRPIKEIMSKKIISITPETPLLEVIDAVVKWDIHTFPVMKGKQLVGIIGRRDILNAAFVYG